jgi:hypothetical protein
MAVLSAPFTRSHAAAAFEVGIKKWFYHQYDLVSKDALYPMIFDVDTAEKQTVTDGVMQGLGLFPQKDEGAPVEYDAIQQAWTKAYTARTFALAVSYTEEAKEDELYGLIPKAGKELGRAAAYTKEVHAWALFNDLTATAYSAGGSNFTVLDDAHYRTDGGTWSNTLSTNAAFSIEALELALSQWAVQMVDQRGLMQMIQPKYVIHSPADKYLVYRVLKSINQPQGQDNDPNAVRAMHNLIPVCVPYLTGDGRWFISASPDDTGLRFFNRIGMKINRYDSEETGNTNMRARFRIESGMTHASGLFGSPGA